MPGADAGRLQEFVLCLILRPTPLDVAIAAVFGALVGGLVLLARRRDALSALIRG